MICSASSASSSCLPEEQAVNAVPHHFGDAAPAGGDDGEPGRGRFQKNQPEALLDLGRAHKDVAQEIGPGHVSRGDKPGEHYPTFGPGQVPAQPAHKRGLPHGAASAVFGAAHQHQHRPGHGFPDPGHGPDQDMDALALPEFPGKEDGGFILKAVLLPNLLPLGIMVPN